MINKLLLIAALILSTGCSLLEPRVEYVEVPQIIIYDPLAPDNPADPGARPKVITVERLNNGELADIAYVGFEYNDWLTFAKWMHHYRAVNIQLRNIIKGYKEVINATDTTTTTDNAE